MNKTESDSEQVSRHIAALQPEIQPAIAFLREIILAAHTEVAEHIKWNSPAFYYTGDMKPFDPKAYGRDILVMNLRKNKIMCVLPTGMKIKVNIEILEGDYTDGRRIINFTNLPDIESKKSQLQLVIKEWIGLIEK